MGGRAILLDVARRLNLSSCPSGRRKYRGGDILSQGKLPGKSLVKREEGKGEKSFVFHTANYSIEFLTFSGKMEPDATISHFTDGMPEDGWRFVSSFKSPKNIMFFLKEGRFCIITITSRTFAAVVQILVTPSFKSIS